MTQINLLMKEKQTHGHREHSSGCQGLGSGRKAVDWEFGIRRCKPLYIKWINNKVLLHSTGTIFNIL